MFDARKAKDECVEWIRKFFEKNGPGCNAVIGISGGKDSSITAALCVEALGRDRVIGVLMPNGIQSDIDMAKLLVDHLGIKSFTVNIKDGYDGLVGSIPFSLSDQSRINLAPRIRMATLYAVSQSNNGRVANTCNLSEDYVGYSTRYGDSVGDFSPCSHFTVKEMREIGAVLGLPDVLIHKVPSDGLCGKTDEDNLGFTYEELDRYIREGYIDDEEKKKKIDRLHEINRFKLAVMPSFDPEKKSEKEYSLGIVVGRFQVLHRGHMDIIKKAIGLCDRVCVLIGSSQESRTAKNPFTYEERKGMLERVFANDIDIAPLPDIGVGNTYKWGEYVIEETKKLYGEAPDLFVTGKEDRRIDWFDENTTCISELCLPKKIDISASEMRDMIIEGDEERWKSFSDPKLYGEFDKMRQIILQSQANTDTRSI